MHSMGNGIQLQLSGFKSTHKYLMPHSALINAAILCCLVIVHKCMKLPLLTVNVE